MSVLEIVVPMAGLGSRFAEAGWTEPKPLISLPDGRRMVELVVEELTPTRPHRFTFVVRAEHRIGFPLDDVLSRAAPGCRIIEVDRTTQGAAETVALAVRGLPGEHPLLIANSDQSTATSIDGFLAQGDATGIAGLIMTMWADHPKWSYASVDEAGWVTEVAEKRVISEHATVGIYWFASVEQYLEGFARMVVADRRVNGEFYVAPVYNELMSTGLFSRTASVEDLGGQMHGLGTPQDLLAWAREHGHDAWASARSALQLHHA